jgi:hypothetical protein
MHKWLLLACVAAACGSPNKMIGNVGGDPGSLGETLLREVGAGVAVAVVPGEGGLRAISADGARDALLVSGPVDWALVDHRAQVIWFGGSQAGSILALDLTAPAATAAPETLVTGLPTETEVGSPLVSIAYSDETVTAGGYATPRVVVHMDATPRLTVDGGILELWEQTEELEALVAQASFVGRDRVAAFAARSSGRRAAPPNPPPASKVEVDPSECEGDDGCGDAEPIAGTSLWRVTTSYSCGDFCYTGYQLYDPQAGRFIDDEWTYAIKDAWVAPDGSAFISAGVVIRFDTGPLAKTPMGELEAVGGGWLGGGHYYP